MNKTAATNAFNHAIETEQPVFEQFFLAKFLGLKFDYPDEQCVITLDVHDYMFNPQGTLHGGIIATVMDILMGHLMAKVHGKSTTLEMKTQYLKAVRGGSLTCRGEFTRRGRTICFMKSTMTDDDGNVVALATATWLPL